MRRGSEPGLKEAAPDCPAHTGPLATPTQGQPWHKVHVLCVGPCVPVLCMTYTHTCICCTITGLGVCVSIGLMAVGYCMSVGLHAGNARGGFQSWVWLCTSLCGPVHVLVCHQVPLGGSAQHGHPHDGMVCAHDPKCVVPSTCQLTWNWLMSNALPDTVYSQGMVPVPYCKSTLVFM